jgi:hypothetical protein
VQTHEHSTDSLSPVFYKKGDIFSAFMTFTGPQALEYTRKLLVVCGNIYLVCMSFYVMDPLSSQVPIEHLNYPRI